MTAPAPAPSADWLRPMLIRCAVALVAVVVTYSLCRSTPSADIKGEAGVNLDLPLMVGDFVGEKLDVSLAERTILPKDTEFARSVYKDMDGNQINCQIVLSGGEKRSIHRPEICLPAQGWTKKSGQAVTIKLDNGYDLKVMKLTIARPVEVQAGVHKELTSEFMYWFVGKGITTHEHWYRILHTDLDRVLHNVNHRWAYVIVSAPVLEGFQRNGKNQQQTIEMLEKFIAEIGPEIIKSDVTKQVGN